MTRSFEQLNTEVQKEIKSVLRAYDSVNVIFENGKYNVSPAMSLKSVYADDREFIGTYYKKDLYTVEDQIIAYIEEFISFPLEYKGKKDWGMINEMQEIRQDGKQARIKLVDGNAVIDSVEEMEW